MDAAIVTNSSVGAPRGSTPAHPGQILTAMAATVGRQSTKRSHAMISKLDFVGIPSQDAARSRAFYVDTLGLRPDERAQM